MAGSPKLGSSREQSVVGTWLKTFILHTVY
jgi:hypothetical protein